MSAWLFHNRTGEHRDLLLDASRVCVFTTLGAYLLGNLVLLDTDTLRLTLVLLAACLLVQLSIFSVAVLAGSLGAGLLVVLTALVLGVITRQPFVDWSLAFAGVVLSLIHVRAMFSSRGDRRVRLLLQVAAIGALVIISSKSPVSFDMLDRLEAGTVHRDTLYHASIASMIKHYGVVSTGLNGLVETPYHVLSHVVVAAVSRLTGMGVLETYGVVPLLLFLPMLLAVYACIAVEFDRTLSYPRAYFFTVLVLAITPRIFKTWGLKESYFGSESYMLALILFAPLLSLLFRRHHGMKDGIQVIGLTVLAAVSKATVGLAVIGLYVVRLLLFTRGPRDIAFGMALLGLMSGLAMIAVMPMVAGNVGGDQVMYWEYLRSNSLAGSLLEQGALYPVVPVAMFVALHFILNWIVIGNRYLSVTGYAWQDPVLVYNLAAIAGALLIVMLPLVGGSSAYFFSGAAMFVALPWIVVLLGKRKYAKVRHPFLVAVILLLLFKGSKLIEKSLLDRDAASDPAREAFVQLLLDWRRFQSADNMLRGDRDSLYADNPVADCNIRPFVYPAVTELAWVDIVHDDCDYYEYGYKSYQGSERDPVFLRRVPDGVNIIETGKVAEE